MFATENDTSGGSRLTDVNELAASPSSSPSTSAATATTPLGKTPNAVRRATDVEVLVGGERVRGHASAPSGVGSSAWTRGRAVSSQAAYAAGSS